MMIRQFLLKNAFIIFVNLHSGDYDLTTQDWFFLSKNFKSNIAIYQTCLYKFLYFIGYSLYYYCPI